MPRYALYWAYSPLAVMQSILISLMPSSFER